MRVSTDQQAKRNHFTGVTSNLIKRVWEHKNNHVEDFASKYGIHTLVWYEPHETMKSAVQREKTIKTGNGSGSCALLRSITRTGIHTLVWYEPHETMKSAVQREKTIKNWKRIWKLRIIEEQNPHWQDLYPDLV